MRYRESIPATLTIIAASMIAGVVLKGQFQAASATRPLPQVCKTHYVRSAGLVLTVCNVPSEDMAEYEYHNGKAYFYVYTCNAVDDEHKTGKC